MAWFSARLERLRQLVAVSIKRGWDPSRIGFADFIIHESASLGVTQKTARSYVKTLVDAFKHNQWLSYVRHNKYLTEDEKKAWMMKHSPRTLLTYPGETCGIT